MQRRTLFIFVILFISFSVNGEERLRFSQAFTEIPGSSKATLKEAFSKEALPAWGLILGSTGALYHYDEEIYSDLQKRGRSWGIGNEDNTSSAVSFGGHEIVRLPSDTGSFMYFLGDGWMHAGIAGGFLAVGNARDDNHAFNTGVMIFHGMIVSTIFNQTLKRSFGRESPEVKTSERGSWNLFPNFNDYNSRTASYDAMPSGHVMTSTLTFTILSERYPEQNHWIVPLGVVWVSALSFQMVNNGVHWASDYPLGIGMGYLIGKISARMTGKAKVEDDKSSGWMLFPGLSGVYATKSF